MAIINNDKLPKSKVITSLAWKILERVCSQGVNLLVQILLARLIAPSDFGSLAIIVAVTNYASLFVQSGLATTLIQKKTLDMTDVNTVLTSSLAVALIMYIALYLCSPWISCIYNLSELTWPLRVLSLVLFLNAINSVQIALLSRNMQFKQIFLRSVIAVPLSGFIGVFLAYKGLGLWALVIYTISSMALTVLVMAFASPYRYKIEFNFARAKELYSFGVKILFTSLVCGFGDTLRVLLIGKKYNTSELAYYDKAYSYSNYFTQIITSSVSGVLLPTFSRAQDNKKDIRRMARRSVSLSSFFIIPFLTLIICTSYPLVCLLLTEKWIPAVPFLCVFCVLRIPACISVIDKHVYYSLGISKIGLYYEIFILSINLGMLFLTIELSIMAVAIGYLVVEMIGCICIFVISSRVYGYSLKMRLTDIFRPVLNSLIVYLILTLHFFNYNSYSLTIAVKMILGFVIYILLSCITKDPNLPYIFNIIKSKMKND